MAYLDSLLRRLAASARSIPEGTRQRALGRLAAWQNPDGGFSGRQGPSNPYYTTFALRSLVLVGGLSPDLAERAGSFLASRVKAPGSAADFLWLVFGSALLEATCGIDVFGQAGHDRRQAVLEHALGYRRSDGGYANTERGRFSSTYHTFLTVACLDLLGLPVPDPDATASCIRSRQQPGGGFAEIPGPSPGATNPTAAAVGLLACVDALDNTTRQTAAGFLASMQTAEGGLRANAQIPTADLLSTFTGLVALSDLGALETIDLGGVRRYVACLELPSGGFRAAIWDHDTDPEYTFYGLGSLSLLTGQTA